MEESLSLLDSIKETFACEPVDIQTYSPLTLAYIGDDVYDLIVRTVVVERGNRAANQLHKSSSRLVNAKAQAQLIEAVMGLLTEQERSVYRRGRNAKSYTSAKNASIADYRKATGLEALFGYLYLTNRTGRILELMKKGFELLGTEL
ncbi:MAG: ribonuclease III [Lachnospiraceae bacterium]|nr:ribonuclease III [Lachnospiraceae bacterium]